MALPTTPIPLVALDEIIEESWGDAVAQSLNNIRQAQDQLLWKPSSEDLSPTSGTFAEWFQVGGASAEITVPDWADHVLAHVTINAAYMTGTGVTTYALRLHVGPQVGREIRHSARQTSTLPVHDYFTVAWMDRFTCSAIEGDRSVRVFADRLEGDDQWAVSGASDIAVFLQFDLAGAVG